MRLHSLRVERAASCGGLLDGLQISFAREGSANHELAPMCLLGPNGSGKSQFLQLIAEIFQAAWHTHDPTIERSLANADAVFELQYSVTNETDGKTIDVRLSRTATAKTTSTIQMEMLIDHAWRPVAAREALFGALLPSLIVGYTSGDNETLSLPFLVSRAGYARDVRQAAFEKAQDASVEDNRLLLIDYGTHLEVLVANLVLGEEDLQRAILEHARLDRLASCRCIVQLNHPRVRRGVRGADRKGIQLTQELKEKLNALRRAATCSDYDAKSETYILDFFIDSASREAFRYFFSSAYELYLAFHKLALLNDLAIPKSSRDRLEREARDRRFASRLPEPQDEDKVFRFERVRLHKNGSPEGSPLDYVSLSDGEHQQAEVFGVFSMIRQANALFLLDEPESHFNPLWRVQFVKRLLELPILNRKRQEVLLTSHAPFVPSDMARDQVLIFSKVADEVQVRRPDVETYGAAFDRILEHCFGVQPPISQLARDEIDHLMTVGTADEIRAAMGKLGSSVDKAFLADRLRELAKS